MQLLLLCTAHAAPMVLFWSLRRKEVQGLRKFPLKAVGVLTRLDLINTTKFPTRKIFMNLPGKPPTIQFVMVLPDQEFPRITQRTCKIRICRTKMLQLLPALTCLIITDQQQAISFAML